MNLDFLGKKNPQLIFAHHGGPISHPEWYVKRYKIKLKKYEESHAKIAEEKLRQLTLL